MVMGGLSEEVPFELRPKNGGESALGRSGSKVFNEHPVNVKILSREKATVPTLFRILGLGFGERSFLSH